MSTTFSASVQALKYQETEINKYPKVVLKKIQNSKSPHFSARQTCVLVKKVISMSIGQGK